MLDDFAASKVAIEAIAIFSEMMRRTWEGNQDV